MINVVESHCADLQIRPIHTSHKLIFVHQMGKGIPIEMCVAITLSLGRMPFVAGVN